jgi:hypothetical protein
MNPRIVLLAALICSVFGCSHAFGQDKTISEWYSSPSEFLAGLKKSRVIVDGNATEMINTIPFVPPADPRTVRVPGVAHLCRVVTVGELGFSTGASLDAFYREAKKRSFKLCPTRLGPGIFGSAHQATDIVGSRIVLIAMEPIRCKDGSLCIFAVRANEEGLGGVITAEDVRTFIHDGDSEQLKSTTPFLFLTF